MLRVYLALLLALISISWAAPLARLAGVPGPVAAWWRLLIGSLATLVFVGLESGLRRFGRGVGWGGVAVGVFAGVMLAGHFALWFESLRYSSIASSTGIVVVYPMLIGLYESLVEHSVSRRVVVGALLGFLGVAVLSTPWSGASLRGSLLAFTAAVLASAYFLAGRRARRTGFSTLSYTLLVYTAAFAALTLYALLARVDPLRVPRVSIPYLVALGLVPMIGGHTLLNYALAYMPAVKVTSVALLEPYGAAIIGWLVLGEQPPPVSLAGAAMTVTGAYLVLTAEEAA